MALIISGLLALKVPYEAALKMPEDIALALLLGGRPNNTRSSSDKISKPANKANEPETAKRIIATRRAKQDKS